MSQEIDGREGRPAEGPAGQILDAARRLFAERGYQNVTVRDVAREAGVTHPLVHYYWGSKKDLLSAVVHGSTTARMVTQDPVEPRDLIISQVREFLDTERQYMLTRGRAFVDGMPAGQWPGGFPGIDAALASLAGGDGGWDDAADRRNRESLIPIVAMVNGWLLLEDHLLEMLGLPDRGAARVALLRAVERLLD